MVVYVVCLSFVMFVYRFTFVDCQATKSISLSLFIWQLPGCCQTPSGCARRCQTVPEGVWHLPDGIWHCQMESGTSPGLLRSDVADKFLGVFFRKNWSFLCLWLSQWLFCEMGLENDSFFESWSVRSWIPRTLQTSQPTLGHRASNVGQTASCPHVKSPLP